MRAKTGLLVAAMAAAGLAVAVPADAARGSGGGGGHSGGGHWSGGHNGGGHWNGGHWNGGHWGGHHGGGHHHGGSWGFYWGWPVVASSLWWGYPYYGYYPSYSYYPYSPYYYYDYGYPPPVYREREVYPQGEISSAEAAPGPGAPTQGPLYMNYCESANAYYPKVNSCPEGWKFIAPQR